MSWIFLKIINMSISAGWLVLMILALRLVLKKAPKWVNVLLWGIVALRLLCPFSFESALSLIPSAETIPEKVLTGRSFQVQTGILSVDDRINDYLEGYYEGITVPVNNGKTVMTALAGLWIAGIVVLLTYSAVSYIRLRRQVRTAVRLQNNIFQSENVLSPFVLGIIKPKIYLPFHVEEQNISHIIAHEQAHIRRRDHWWKPFGFLLLTVHWFNPLMWLAYVVLCRDIELACDEKVIRELGAEQRAGYSQALLDCSISRRMIAVCPLAFGEVGVKKRVKSVLKYKKPAFWIAIAAVAVCVTVAVCFLTDPIVAGADATPFGHTYRIEKSLYNSPQFFYINTEEAEVRYTLTADYSLFVAGVYAGNFLGTELSASSFDDYFVDYDNAFGWHDDTCSPESIRRDTKKAWRLEAEYGSQNQDFYYLIQTRENDVYLVYGHETEGQRKNIFRMFQLAPDGLICNTVSEGWGGNLGLGKYSEGTDWREKKITEGVINGSGVMYFDPEWDTETLLVREEYYRDYGNGETKVERAIYELSRDQDGRFALEVARRGEGQEEAIYTIDGIGGVYMMKIVYKVPFVPSN